MRFSLRSMLICLFLLASIGGLIAKSLLHARMQHQLAVEITASGGAVTTRPSVGSRVLAWCARTRAEGDIVAVDLRSPEVTRRFLHKLEAMPHLRDCTVVGPTIDDKSLIAFFGSRKIRSVTLDSTSVSRSGKSQLTISNPHVSVNFSHRWSNQLIHSLGLSVDAAYDPACAIRAANHLQCIGKVNAIRALQDYVDQRPVEDHQVLCLLVPLVFERINPDELFPAPVCLKWTDEYSEMLTEISLGQKSQEDLADLEDKYATRFTLIYERWSDDFGELIVCDGIPFHVVLHFGVFGQAKLIFRRDYLIAWAAEKGRLRETRIVPTDKPEDSVRRLISRFGDSFASPIERGWWREECITQVELLLGGLVSKSQIAEAVSDGHPLHVRWDEQLGAYVFQDTVDDVRAKKSSE